MPVIYAPPIPTFLGGDNVLGMELDPRIPNAGAVIGGVNRAFVKRVLARKSGFLRDFVIGVSVASGLIDIGVFDCGETTPAVYTRLGSWAAANAGVAQACPAAGVNPAASGVTWDPGAGAIPIIAGREYAFMISNDNNTAQLYRFAGAMQSLPASFMPGGGGMASKPNGVLASLITLGVLPATVPDASVVGLAVTPWIYARISPT